MKITTPMKIGDVRVKNRLFLAPMVDVTDLVFRILCRKQGVGMAYTEMLYIDAILHENEKTKSLMKTNKNDRPIGLQITGNNTDEFRKLVKLDLDYDLIDINCGCPSIRITGSEAGSFLLKNPEKIEKMIKILKEKYTTTAKIRLGFKKNNPIEIAKKIEKAGAELITVHARLANQGNSVKADWNEIRKVKDSVGIPVIGNGDIFSGKDAEELMDFCDGVMVARGAIGNPFIFREILRYSKSGKEKEIKKEERLKAFGDYLKLAKKYNIVDLSRIKYLGSGFYKEFDCASKMRDKLMKCKTYDEIHSLNDFFQEV